MCVWILKRTASALPCPLPRGQELQPPLGPNVQAHGVFRCCFAAQVLQLKRGVGIAQWLERMTRDRKVAGSSPLQERRENFILQGQLPVLALISVSVPPPCYRSSM